MDTLTADPEVAKNFRWNFSVNLLDISFIMLGLGLVSRETVIPLLVSHLTSSTVAIGLVPAVYSLGLYLPQLLGAGLTGSLIYKKPFLIRIGFLGERLPYLLCGIAILLFAESYPILALGIIVLMFGWSGAGAGFAMPAWFDMIAKVIPLQRRGLFTGLGHGLGALMGVAGAAGIGAILVRWEYPLNFSLLFIFAFVAMVISWVGISLNREPASRSVAPSLPLTHYFRSLPNVLRANQNFARFLGAVAVVRVGTMAGGFFVVYGVSRFQLGGNDVGLLTGVLIGCQAILNPLWGMLGDRSGHKVVLVSGALCLALAATLAWLVPSWIGLVAAFFFLGAFLSSDSASFLTILPEFCQESERPTYVGLTNTLLAPVISLAPLLGGWLASVLGFTPMFAIAAAFALAGSLLLARLVADPRHQVAAPLAV